MATNPQPDPSEERAGCDCQDRGCTDMSRRRFIQVTGISAAALTSTANSASAIAGPFDDADLKGHFIPADKKLNSNWIKELYAKGEPTIYRDKELETIGMPIGGICAGQLYLAGDGRLMHWSIFNQRKFTGYGRNNYTEGRKPESMIEQGFAIRITSGTQTITRRLDIRDFPNVTFRGEYPIGTVEYPDPSLPIAIQLEAYSPFIPLATVESALPATIMEFRVKNRSGKPVRMTLAGWLQNAVSHISAKELPGTRSNRIVQKKGMTMVCGTARGIPAATEIRPPRVLADFEGSNYGDWTAQGDALGKGPAQGTLPRQNRVAGFEGAGLVNTFAGGDRTQGTLTSPLFIIDRPYLCFLIGGGNQKGKTCIHLLVDGEPVRTATGENNERLRWMTWDIKEFDGKEAQLKIIDAATGPWGHVNVDQIELCDAPKHGRKGLLEDQEDFGSMGLAVLEGLGETLTCTALPAGEPAAVVFSGTGLAASGRIEQPLNKPLIGAVGKSLLLEPDQEVRLPFVIAWSFPKRADRGAMNFYANQFPTSQSVAEYIAEHFSDLSRDTRRWHATWYDSTLPHWLLDRLFSTTSNLATGTCHWWGNGRFWAWEGVGCCAGTCAHVWNYEQTLARLFPRLERSVREMQDFDVGLVAETGEIHFRGESNDFWAGDGQAGTILKAFREHQISTDDSFVRRNWPHIRKALEFLINQDLDENGILEGSQHNTYDINFEGPNTMIGSLYLGALRAGEEMAKIVADHAFAKRCRALYERGREWTLNELFNGEFFIQKVDLEKHPKFQYAGGCLSDQLFGQSWAHQVGLGYLYPKESIVKTLESIWKYNWAPDIGPQNEHFKPGRWFAMPGEAGLFTCTWPNDDRMRDGVRYKNEVWTGIEYQVASHMAWEGMITEALAICRGIHERYHPSKRNPWNEVECGDHYARAMASYGVFLGLCGFEYNGPKAHLGFAPRITPENFRAAFTAAEGWGTLDQKRSPDAQTNQIEVQWGNLSLATIAVQLPVGKTLASAAVEQNGKKIPNTQAKQTGSEVTIALGNRLLVNQDQTVAIHITYS